jgi:hypothetical protein
MKARFRGLFFLSVSPSLRALPSRGGRLRRATPRGHSVDLRYLEYICRDRLRGIMQASQVLARPSE